MTTNQLEAGAVELEWEEVARSLFNSQHITHGLWRLAVKVHLAAITAQFEIQPGVPVGMPTGLVGMAGLALMPVTEPGLMVYDASLPRPQRSTKSSAKSVAGGRLATKKRAPKA